MARSRNRKKRRPRLVHAEEIVEHLQENRHQVMGPIADDGDWKLLALSEDAPPGTPPMSIPLFVDEDGGLWGEMSIVEAVIRSTRSSPQPHGEQATTPLDEYRPPEEVLSWIQTLGHQGHVGTDMETDDRWIHITQCVPNIRGEIVCTPIGDVPIEFLPDGRPGVSVRALEEILGMKLPPVREGSFQRRY